MSRDIGGKVEYPPLLKIGRHPHTLDAIDALCVRAFPSSPTRPAIMAGLTELVVKLDEVKIAGEIWVDGSFLTKKDDPEDVDLILRMQSAFADNCTAEQNAIIQWVAGDLHDSHKCHSFVLVQWPEGGQFYWEGEYGYAYWMRQWGFSRSDAIKGIAVVQLPGGEK